MFERNKVLAWLCIFRHGNLFCDIFTHHYDNLRRKP